MIAVVVAAAATLGTVTYEEGGCDIGEFTTRVLGTYALGNLKYEYCSLLEANSGDYKGNDYCKVSQNYYCCANGAPYADMSWCVLKTTEAECHAIGVSTMQDSTSTYKWCGPAPPASEKLSSGAIGGIVVGAYLGVAAIGGAAAAYRGVV